MKYCRKCGAQIEDDAEFCSNCGEPVNNNKLSVTQYDSTLAIVIKVFMILDTIALGFFIIPLAWCIPMTVSTFRRLDNNEPIGVGFKVCTLLFVGLIPGILLLVLPELDK